MCVGFRGGRPAIIGEIWLDCQVLRPTEVPRVPVMEKGGSHEALVRQAVAGDRLAISDLLLEHYDWLQKYISRHLLSPLAGSATSEVPHGRGA